MTDLEISKALALAIGHTTAHIGWLSGEEQACLVDYMGYLHSFDYRDWNVIGPIAAKYDCFPVKDMYSEWVAGKYPYVYADTPQKAIALAVIESVK